MKIFEFEILSRIVCIESGVGGTPEGVEAQVFSAIGVSGDNVHLLKPGLVECAAALIAFYSIAPKQAVQDAADRFTLSTTPINAGFATMWYQSLTLPGYYGATACVGDDFDIYPIVDDHTQQVIAYVLGSYGDEPSFVFRPE